VGRKVYKLWFIKKEMYENELLKLRKMPVFSLSDVSQIVSGKEYAKKLLLREVRKGRINRIKRDLYTYHNDSLLVSTYIIKPSYITGVSALSYHGLITQITKEIFCNTLKKSTKIEFYGRINYNNTKNFYGIKNYEYEGFIIPIAIPEKALIDSIRIVPLSLCEEAIKELNKEAIIGLLKKEGKSSTTKRIGYLLEKHGNKVFKELRGLINNKYIYLDPLAKKKGKKNKKWRMIINT